MKNKLLQYGVKDLRVPRSQYSKLTRQKRAKSKRKIQLWDSYKSMCRFLKIDTLKCTVNIDGVNLIPSTEYQVNIRS